MVLKPFTLFAPMLLLLPHSAAVFAQITGEIPQDAEPIEIRVHASPASSAPIPESIFGSFLEPIDNSTYGGLWAELLENPSLEAGLWTAPNFARMIQEQPELARALRLDLPLPWAPIYPEQGNRYETRRGEAANSYQSLLIMALPQSEPNLGEVGIRQRVYLPVRRELKYVGNLWVKHVAGPVTLDVSVRERNDPENVLAHAVISAANGEWTKYPFTLELKPNQLQPLKPADFTIALSNDARALIDQISLMPADNVDGMDPDVLRLAKDIHSPLMRFGGNFTSSYHWRDGIGPLDKRVSMLNLAWGMPEYNTFGTDEFLRFCELIGAQPQIALNLGSGTPEETAAWVRYVNQHWENHQGGLLWELGNELWGNWNMGYPAAQQIGERTARFSEAVREADPKAKLIATGADPDHYQDWNAQQLGTPANTFDYISTHFVVRTGSVQLHDPSDDFIALANFALPVALSGRLKEMTQQIQQSSHRNVKIAFTEWLFAGREATPNFTNMGGAIDTAGFLDMLMQNAAIVPISDMTGIMDFAGISKAQGQAFGAPGYWVLRMYADARPARLLPVEDASPVYSVQHGSTRLPEIGNVPWLEVVATQAADPDKLVLFCVNRSLTRDLRARITLDGLVPEGAAQVKTLVAPSIYSENDAMNPDAVTPRVSQVNVGRTFAYTFPHASVTVIEVQRKKG